MADPIITLADRPVGRRAWWADINAHRGALSMLARKDFQTRYKRATFGILWAVAVPVLQGAIMAFVFSRVVRTGSGEGFGAYVMSGIIGWSYFGGALNGGSTAVVDGSGLTDKVWFPRLLLVLVPVLSGLVGLVISLGVLLAIGPLVHVRYEFDLLLLIPAVLLLVAFTVGLALVLSALHVYFRDVRFIVQAALLVWLYLTPIVYPKRLLGAQAGWLDLNPMTGIVSLLHAAIGQEPEPYGRAVAVSVLAAIALLAIGLEAHRRHDRLFVDLL